MIIVNLTALTRNCEIMTKIITFTFYRAYKQKINFTAASIRSESKN